MVGVILPLAILYGGWLDNMFVYLIPILYQILSVLSPPTVGGIFMMLVAFIPTAYMCFGVLTLGMEFSFDRPGEIWPSFLTIVVFWIAVVPPLKASKNGLVASMLLVVVLLPVRAASPTLPAGSPVLIASRDFGSATCTPRRSIWSSTATSMASRRGSLIKIWQGLNRRRLVQWAASATRRAQWLTSSMANTPNTRR